MDITGAFLQAEDLDREVYVKPPKDIRKEGIVWRRSLYMVWMTVVESFTLE